MRTWEANVLNDGRISIVTEAYEIPRVHGSAMGLFNYAGVKLFRGDQATVWDVYFKNIDQRFFGGKGETIPFHHKRVEEPIENPLAHYFKKARQ